MSFETMARYLALKGEEHVVRFERIIAEARALIDNPGFTASITAQEQAVQDVPFTWETEEAPTGVSPTFCLASIQDFATGQGMTIWLFAGKAHSEAEFRRFIAHEAGHYLADGAIVGHGSDGQVPYREMLMPPAILAWIQRIERGDDDPATFMFVAKSYANYT